VGNKVGGAKGFKGCLEHLDNVDRVSVGFTGRTPNALVNHGGKEELERELVDEEVKKGVGGGEELLAGLVNLWGELLARYITDEPHMLMGGLWQIECGEAR
jgi:hypothetical protein